MKNDLRRHGQNRAESIIPNGRQTHCRHLCLISVISFVQTPRVIEWLDETGAETVLMYIVPTCPGPLILEGSFRNMI